MKNYTAQGIEIVVLSATFTNGTDNAAADMYQEKNKSFVTAVAAGTCAPCDSEFVCTQVLNPSATATQENYYTMMDDMGRNIGTVIANDIKEATKKAHETRTPRFWKVKRLYQRGCQRGM